MPEKETNNAPAKAAAVKSRPRKTVEPRKGGLTVIGPGEQQKPKTIEDKTDAS